MRGRGVGGSEKRDREGDGGSERRDWEDRE